MKIRITKPGLMAAVGRVLNVKGEPPAAWAGKYEIIDPAPVKPAPRRKAVKREAD